MFNRRVFFDAVRARPFGGTLAQAQVDGISAILDAWDVRRSAGGRGAGDIRWLAYMLATTFHETARTMQPIREYGGRQYFTRMYDISGTRPHVARALGNTHPGDGARFHGRGYVQLTGRRNYVRAEEKTGAGLIADPDLAMEPALAARILFAGMEEGWFTGKRLADYFNQTSDDPVNARRIVNGLDRADAIAFHHRAFHAALSEAQAATDRQTATGRDGTGRSPPDAPDGARGSPAGHRHRNSTKGGFAALFLTLIRAIARIVKGLFE